MSEYDLTIITVCRNAGTLLSDTLQSVIWHKECGRLRIEHIVIDGASTDCSLQIALEAYHSGKIEQFISETDCGIYDAMNKGIARASGKVLYFLNCGDVLCKLDLLELISPILKGETVAVAGSIITVSGENERKDDPTDIRMFQGVYTSHQAYFSASKLYKELGVFDISFKCIADADFMARVTQKYGVPLFINCAVAYSPAEGVSNNSRIKYLPEYVRLRKLYWNEIVMRIKDNKKYLYFTFSRIIEDVSNLEAWLDCCRPNNDSDFVKELQRQCENLSRLFPDYKRKIFLLLISRFLLPHFIKQHRLSFCLRMLLKYKKLKLVMRFCPLKLGTASKRRGMTV